MGRSEDNSGKYLLLLLLIIVADFVLTINISIDNVNAIAEPTFGKILLCLLESVGLFVGIFLLLALMSPFLMLLYYVFALLMLGQYYFFCFIGQTLSSEKNVSANKASLRYRQLDEYGTHSIQAQDSPLLKKILAVISVLAVCALIIWHIVIYIGQ